MIVLFTLTLKSFSYRGCYSAPEKVVEFQQMSYHLKGPNYMYVPDDFCFILI